MSAWFNYATAIKILVFGLVVGAGLPALFAMGVRINAEGAGVARHGHAVAQRNPAGSGGQLADFRRGVGGGDRRCAVHRPRLHRSPHRLVHPRRQADVTFAPGAKQVKLAPVPGVRSIRGAMILMWWGHHGVEVDGL